MKGAYVLILKVPEHRALTIKSLGKIVFDKGTWMYVGSAMGSGSTSLEKRIKRHFQTQKNVHWHIDFLLSQAACLSSAVFVESPQRVECLIAKNLQANRSFIPGPRGFGASDCTNGCISHVFKYLSSKKPQETIMRILSELGFEPRITLSESIL